MERGNGFFGQLFSRGPEKKTDAEPIQPTRREFLQKAAKLAAGVVVSATALESKSVFADEPLKEEKYVREALRYAEVKKAEAALSEMFDLTYEYRKKFGNSRNEWTLAEQDEIRAAFLAKFGERIPTVLMQADKSKTKSFARSIGETMAFADCYGLYYQHLRQTGAYKNRQKKIDEEHYAVHASDFLPTADEITLEEIDPRLGQMERGDVSENILANEGWTNKKRQEAFKKILEDADVRNLVEHSDCTLAEVYSLIKSMMAQESGNVGSHVSLKERTKRLLLEREEMKKRVFMGKELDQLIIYNFVPKTDSEKEAQFDRKHLLDALALATMRRTDNGIPETDENIKKRVTRIQSSDSTISEPETGRSMSPTTRMRDAIRESRGKSTIYFNNHGGQRKQYTESGEMISASDLAHELLSRLENTKNARSLQDMNIIFNSCFSYDFAKKVEQVMRVYYKEERFPDPKNPSTAISYEAYFQKSFDQIPLPTIVTIAQEGSYGYGSMLKSLETNRKAIEKEGKLTGAMLMRRIQPEYYPDADMAFFSGKKGGLLEVGVNEVKESETHAA